LPLALDIPFKVGRLTYSGNTTLEVTDLGGKYIFDSNLHRLDEGYAHISSGTYQLNGQLQARAPMALTLQLDGQVQTTIPGSDKPVSVAASARLTGKLAGQNAELDLQAELKPEVHTSAMQANLSAKLAPWQAQPLINAQAQWKRLDVAALWPQMPQTDLSGQVQVTPKAESWLGHVQLDNALPGPWNEQRLPLNTLAADFGFNHGQWHIQSLAVNVAGGSLSGSGQFQTGVWSGNAKLQNIHPSAIDTRLDSAPLSGEFKAAQTASGIGFAVNLNTVQPTPAGKPATSSNKASTANLSKALQIQTLQAKGLWAAPQLTLTDVQLKAADAQLGGQLAYNTQTLASQAKLDLTLPGLQASLDGHVAPQTGLGQLSLQVSDAAAARQWLSRWPMVASAFQGQTMQGTAQLQASWQGGWQQTDTQAPGLRLTTQGQAHLGSRELHWQATADGGQIQAGHWQGRLNQLDLRAQDDANPGFWSLALGGAAVANPADHANVSLDWQDLGKAQTLSIAAGSAQLTGPLPGQSLLSWQAFRWTQAAAARQTTATPKSQWQGQGQFTQLPLAWVDAVSGKPMAKLDLSSDLMLSGQWRASYTDALQLSVSVERSAGDLRLRTEGAGRQMLPALLNEAWLNLNLAGDQLSGSLRWDSERAGKALLAFSTRLQSTAQGWRWPEDAPVGGSVQVQLPPVDAWSVLAPPGWRMRGTLQANASLTGTRQQPQWQGTLQADNLAVRSVADGIDFQQGSLRARLDGQQLHMDELTLHGAGGQAGGVVKVTGLAQWLQAGQPGLPLTQHVQMTMQAKAQNLRLSGRSDRQITVSGELNAELTNNILTLGGKLGVDKALFTLPSETAPVLGDDVVVRASARSSTKPDQAKITPTALAGPPTAQAVTTRVQVSLDLGADFQLRGRGLDSHLTGQLDLQASGSASPSVRGTVRTVRGTFAAYGQKLDIEQGVLRFVGPVDNPALDILAIRPKLTQRVGVQVLGTAQAPVIRLYADPDLPEAEKLAWLVLGRSAGGSGGESALLQQAALALLGGAGQGPSARLTQALGLDEISFRGSSSDTASGAGVTLGKRLSNDFYVAYESGLAGTVGVFTIFYDLSKRLTLRAQTGEQSAFDLIWTHRYD
jgi:translocation and assembly module TamB